jgi:hypothetical protein
MNHCGMIAFCAIISGANPIPPGAIHGGSSPAEAAGGTWIFATPRAGTFARAG